MHFREMPSPLRGKKVGFLDDLFVLPESRGTGVVDEMFKKLSKESAKNWWPFVRWITAKITIVVEVYMIGLLKKQNG